MGDMTDRAAYTAAHIDDVPDPAVVRGAVAREAGTTMLVVGAEPGCVFTPSGWDTEPLPD